MNEWMHIAGAFAAGGLLAGAYLAALWHTIRALPHSRHPAVFALISLFGRLGVLLAGFYIVSQGRWAPLVAAVAGFTLVRMIVTGRVRPHTARLGDSEEASTG
ncbi:MAG: ATP synthase subunit I [Gammaproteobacteria bacterium]|nr:ATP synthase subunit I [Gammaproteobacteria bacterium]NIR30352.1 ATP synthase subunit I [Gammaproteobacteria bacterium]NIR98196.1 ATP synthase subunit I [Gammaproteobacteria bacterium]NIT63863.1 ATP synthase subunit I [Gammaproteobacteria bacterium]NIV20867.1 ATP synthase subunit I [Gammaproteobacteria bacterium]